MTSAFRLRRHLLVAAAGSALLTLGPAPTAAASEFDANGYLDSAARCNTPEEVFFVGATESSQVAICQFPDDRYEYRGVRDSDGAALVAPASRSGGVSFIAQDHGLTYTVTTHSVVVSRAGEVIRRERMTDFHDRAELDTLPRPPAPLFPPPPPPEEPPPPPPWMPPPPG